MSGWDAREVQALGEERLQLMREAAEKKKRKTGMESLDVFLEYGERLSAGGSLPPQEQKALLAAVAASLPKEEHLQLLRVMTILGL